MKHLQLWSRWWLASIAVLMVGLIQVPAHAADAKTIDRDARAALQSLYASSPGAKALGDKAKAILVFPSVLKAGLIVGAQGGDGVLIENGQTVGFYNTAAVSVGLQAGAQEFGYVMFFMTDQVLNDFRKSNKFEIGVGPTVVFLDAGAAKDLNTLTAKADVYAIIFNQKGLMAGIGLQGSKITKLDK
jgi:lipid-binding SYLF domain-containing protein